jgi:hypothetical protein
VHGDALNPDRYLPLAEPITSPPTSKPEQAHPIKVTMWPEVAT